VITFFTHCRPFEGEFDALQRMALESWGSAVPDCEIINVANSVAFNEHGTALVNSIFEVGEQKAHYDLLCEVSSDIVLGADINRALQAIADIERPFVVGQRWDIEPGAHPDTAKLHPPSAADYFIYRRGTLGEIPPFAVGRTCYDNWLIWAAIHRWDMTVIDATEIITAIHVNHGHPEYGSKARMMQSDERRENYRLMLETAPRHFQVDDAPYVLRKGKVEKR
jgi:hypothetical protein